MAVAGVNALKRLQAETTAGLDALIPAFLDRAFKGESWAHHELTPGGIPELISILSDEFLAGFDWASCSAGCR
jgi:hypothetical protein